MENVILVSSNSSAAEALTVFIRDTFHCNVTRAETAQQARGLISGNRSWEMVIVNTPLSDEIGIELAEYAAEMTAACCIVIVKNENYEKVSRRADRNGIILIAKPFTRNIMYQVLKAADTALRRTYELYEENMRLERKLDELRLIDTAKFRLMQYRNMTEEEAHSYLEQYAMNNRKKKTVAASEIIDKINEQYL